MQRFFARVYKPHSWKDFTKGSDRNVADFPIADAHEGFVEERSMERPDVDGQMFRVEKVP